MGDITDTSKTPARQRMLESMVMGKDYITNQEAQGTRELVASEMLPVKGSNSPGILALGIEWGEVDPNDALFRKAKLPAGWKKVRGDDARATLILDDKGVQRAIVFYKAAHYDRYASISLA